MNHCHHITEYYAFLTYRAWSNQFFELAHVMKGSCDAYKRLSQ